MLTFLAEILGTKELHGSLDLVSQLLDTLGKIIHHDSPVPSDTSYICQMFMAAVEEAASKMKVFFSLLRAHDSSLTMRRSLLSGPSGWIYLSRLSEVRSSF